MKDAEEYSDYGSETYTSDVVDVILGATANTIESNVGIFQNIGGKAVVKFQHCNKTPTERTIYLKFDYYPDNLSRNHYSAIVLDNNPKSDVGKKKTTWADVASKKTPHKYVNKMKQMEMSLLHQYGENYESVQWDMEDESLATEVKDVYVPMLPNQSHRQENKSLTSLNNRSKNDGDRGEVLNVSDVNTAGIIEIEPPDVSCNEDKIVSQMKEVLDIHSKTNKE